jgi:(1->4)-alpha-D-glucan 1-alpha-D-glucosylmutase
VRPLIATYRLQMNAGFTLSHARARVDYFASLGVSHLYCSPILAARTGSMHGYDVVDPARINPQLGTEADLRALADDLHAREMGLILDIVPNHMGTGAENPYWGDVLAHGERSRYARWFDIDWAANTAARRKLVLPILGDELDRVLERNEISLRFREHETPRIAYFDHSFPIDPTTLSPELQLAQLDPAATHEAQALYSGAAGRDRLRALLDAQHYQLVSFRRGWTDVNYRRFFDVTDLVGLRMEDPEVFTETHALVLRLVHEGIVDGLRIDHIDGLLDPEGYLNRLRSAVSPETPIVVEKILAPDEQLRSSWPVQGTTGYEFLNDVEDVFVDPAGFAEIERDYRRRRKLGETTFHDIVLTGKTTVLNGPLRADVDRLAVALGRLAHAAGMRWTRRELASAVVDFTVSLPVYRTYVDPPRPIDDVDRDLIEQSGRDAQAGNSSNAPIVAFIVDVLLGRLQQIDQAQRGEFVRRLQQLTGPAAAKGLEDNALYVYVPLVSRNEVGGAPDRPLDDALGRLHKRNAKRAQHWPSGLLCTTTHDTKRSADVRSRIDVLSEIPHEWERSVRRWRRLNQKHRRIVKGRMAPDINSEYLLYQSLIALWPPPRPGRRVDDLPDRRWRESARDRLTQYLHKAAREAKMRTTWTDPDPGYESAITDFVAAVLEPAEDAPFLPDVARLVSVIATAGAWNALSRLAIHLTAPGTPDIYQGDEFWNYVLVDPDNRRQVDYDARVAAMSDMPAIETMMTSPIALDPHDQRVKLFITARLLHARRTNAEVFTRGAYRMLAVTGSQAKHVIAFAREHAGRCAITVASRLTHASIAAQPSEWWADTAIALPPELHGRCWESQLTPDTVSAQISLELRRLFVKLPMTVAVG